MKISWFFVLIGESLPVFTSLEVWIVWKGLDDLFDYHWSSEVSLPYKIFWEYSRSYLSDHSGKSSLVTFLINLRIYCKGQWHKFKIFLYFGQFVDMLFLRLCSCMLKVNLVFSLKQQIHQWSFTWLNLKICNHFSYCVINMLDPNIACLRNNFRIFEIKNPV